MHRTMNHYGLETADLVTHWTRYHAQGVTCPGCFFAAHAQMCADSPKRAVDLTGPFPYFTV
jgi:hypothetical protein